MAARSGELSMRGLQPAQLQSCDTVDESEMTIDGSALPARRCGRQRDSKSTTARRVVEHHTAAMRLRDPARDRQAEPGTCSAARALEAYEAIEDSFAVGRR